MNCKYCSKCHDGIKGMTEGMRLNKVLYFCDSKCMSDFYAIPPKQDLKQDLAFKERQIAALRSKLIRVSAFLLTNQISDFEIDHPKSLPKKTVILHF